jgi:surface antigen
MAYDSIVSYYKSKNSFITSKPKQGHQIFLKKDGKYYHTGLVYKVDKSYVYVVEGNSSSGVRFNKYILGSSIIGGYGVPMYEQVSDKTPYVYSYNPPLLKLQIDQSTIGWNKPLPEGSFTYPTYASGAYGWRVHPIYKDVRFHNGIDMAAPGGTNIYATRSGTVSQVGFSSGAGNYIKIDHGTIGGSKYSSRYLHMLEPSTYKVGAAVSPNEVIGFVGSTGDSTGNHLHFEIHKDGVTVDPAEYIFASDLTSLLEKGAPNYNYFKPLYTSTSTLPTFDGNGNSLLNRRGHILNDNEVQLLQYGKFDRLFYGGISPCGQSSINGASPIDLVSAKTAIDKLVYDESTGKYAKGEFNSDNKLTVAKYIYCYLINCGWSPNAIFALLGNMVHESGLNPARWESDTDWSSQRDIQKGFGLIQWTPWNKFWDWATNRGLDPYDIDSQLLRISEGYDWGKTSRNSEYGKKCMDYIKSSDTYKSKGELQRYIDSLSSSDVYIFNLTKSEFSKSYLPLEVLTTAYLVCAERPKHPAPDSRIKSAMNFEVKLPSGIAQRVSPPEPNEKYWLKKGESIKGTDGKTVYGVNPYSVVLTSSKDSVTTLPNNNAYCWGRASEIIYNATKEDLYLCEKEDQDWYDYALNTKKYECGRIPRVGSVICWSYSKLKQGAKKLSCSYVSVVEQVIGNDSIVISTMPHDCSTIDDVEDAFEYRVLNNTDSNWGLDSDLYEFRGFIYLLDISKINRNISVTDTIELQSFSTNCRHTSVSIGVNDMKHFNKMRVVYDISLTKLKDEDMPIESKLRESCKVYIHMSQRVNSYSGDICEDWSTSYFPNVKDAYDEEGNQIKKAVFEGPFPSGVVFLRNSLPSSLFKNENYDEESKTYTLNNIIDIVSLNRTNVKGTYTNVFHPSTWEGYNEDRNELKKFNRQLQTYLGATLVADPCDSFTYSLKMNIKQIILYR